MPDEPLEIPADGYARGAYQFTPVEPNGVAGVYLPPGGNNLTAHFVVDAITMLCKTHGVDLPPDWPSETRSSYMVVKMLSLLLAHEQRQFELLPPRILLPPDDLAARMLAGATWGIPPDEDDAPPHPRRTFGAHAMLSIGEDPPPDDDDPPPDDDDDDVPYPLTTTE